MLNVALIFVSGLSVDFNYSHIKTAICHKQFTDHKTVKLNFF